MTIPLPPTGANSADDHMAISRVFVDHARNELRLGNNLQASEKVWGAAAHAIKAIAIERGWRHQTQGATLQTRQVPEKQVCCKVKVVTQGDNGVQWSLSIPLRVPFAYGILGS